MRGYWVILRTELFGLFISPSTYVASYFLALLGIGFRFFIESFMSSNWILPPLSSLVLGLIFGAPALIPFLTMRSFAEESLGTLGTLLSAPVNTTALVWEMECKLSVLCFDCLWCFLLPLLLWTWFPTSPVFGV